MKLWHFQQTCERDVKKSEFWDPNSLILTMFLKYNIYSKMHRQLLWSLPAPINIVFIFVFLGVKFFSLRSDRPDWVAPASLWESSQSNRRQGHSKQDGTAFRFYSICTGKSGCIHFLTCRVKVLWKKTKQLHISFHFILYPKTHHGTSWLKANRIQIHR